MNGGHRNRLEHRAHILSEVSGCFNEVIKLSVLTVSITQEKSSKAFQVKCVVADEASSLSV